MNTQQDQYKQDSYRFLNVLIFCLSAIADSFVVQSFSTISIQIQNYYHVSQTQVNLCALVFMIIHPFMTFIANYILVKYGIKIGCTINSIVVIIGLLIRCLININFIFAILGNVVIAIGNIFILNSPSQLAANWFKPEKRLLITSLGLFSTSISGGIGAFVSSMLIPKNLQPEQGKKSVLHLIFLQGLFVGIIMILNLIFFRGKPKTPPAPSSQKKREQFFQSFKKIFTNKNFIVLFMSFVFLIGSANTFYVTIQFYLQPFSFSSQQAGNVVILSILTGLIGSVIFSYIIKKNKLPKKTIIIQLICAISSCTLIQLCLWFNFKIGFWIALAGLGFFLYPAIPGMIQLGCQIVFPAAESNTAGFMLAGGSLFSFCIGLLQSYVINGNSKNRSEFGGGINILILMICLLLFVNVKQDLKRKKFEQNKGLMQEQGDDIVINRVQ